MSFLESLRRLLPRPRQVPGGPPVTRLGRDSFVVELGPRNFQIDCDMLTSGPSFVIYPSEVYEVRPPSAAYEIRRAADVQVSRADPVTAGQVVAALKAHFALNRITYTTDGPNAG